MHKNATKCNETLSKWCKNKHGASKIIDMFETYHASVVSSLLWKQKELQIFELISSQEDASNQLSVGMSVFVERTSTMKKECIPL
jgi:hypothetical protein